MRFLKMFRTMVHNADFFSTTQLIRYQQDPDFKTFTGGIFSLAIVILLAVIFGSMSLSAVRREQIEWAHQISIDSVPPRLNLPFNIFNVGIELAGMNLSSTVKYFDVVMTQTIFKNKTFVSNNEIPLTMCNRSDWNQTADILGNFDRMNATNWYCPDPNSQFFVQGKWTSDHFNYLQISVLDCGTFHPNATCANQSQIATKLANKIHFSIYYVNALISPSSKQAVTYYMADKDFIYFGNKLGSSNQIFISDYQIQTDHSILPYQDKRMEKGGFVMLPTTISTQEVGNGWYSNFRFRKSTDKHIYTRAFHKFDTVISYIGGLFGAIIGILFLMNHYTRTNFEISLGSLIYVDSNYQCEDGGQARGMSMNICYYFAFWVYKGLTIVGCKLDWPFFAKLDRYRQEIRKHLDIKLMIDKMNFLQRSLWSLTGEDKYKALHLRERITLEEAKKFRQYHYLRPLMIAQILKKKKQRKVKLDIKEKMMEKPIQEENVRDTPMRLIKPRKITPTQQKQNKQIELSANQDMVQSSYHNTINFTKKTRWYMNENKSNMSQNQDIEDQFQIQVPNIMESLDSVYKMALNGDHFCQQIWNNIDRDVKVVLQKKFKKQDIDFIVEKSVNLSKHEDISMEKAQ